MDSTVLDFLQFDWELLCILYVVTWYVILIGCRGRVGVAVSTFVCLFFVGNGTRVLRTVYLHSHNRSSIVVDFLLTLTKGQFLLRIRGERDQNRYNLCLLSPLILFFLVRSLISKRGSCLGVSFRPRLRSNPFSVYPNLNWNMKRPLVFTEF